MTAIEHIQAANAANLGDRMKLSPALGTGQIEALQNRVGQPLPKELREVLAFCSGINGPFGGVSFISFAGEQMSYEQEAIFPHGLPIAADDCGNFWVLDITPQTTLTAPVFFACHDAPVILYQSADIASFLAEVFRLVTSPRESLIHQVLGDRLFHVWRKNPGVIDQATAASSSDAELRGFASGLAEHFQ